VPPREYGTRFIMFMSQILKMEAKEEFDGISLVSLETDSDE
jgi:hypothetical protein